MTQWHTKIFEQLKGLNKTGKPLPKAKILALPLMFANWLAVGAVSMKMVELVLSSISSRVFNFNRSISAIGR